MAETITIKRGAPWRRQWLMRSPAGEAINLLGASVQVRLREKTDAIPVFATVEITNAEGGIFASELSAEQLAEMPRVMHLDVIHTDSLGKDAIRESLTVWLED